MYLVIYFTVSWVSNPNPEDQINKLFVSYSGHGLNNKLLIWDLGLGFNNQLLQGSIENK